MGESNATCQQCGRRYERDQGHWDFAPELEFADAVEVPSSHQEEVGERFRAQRYYMPRLRALAEAAGRPVSEMRVLDDGCGWGAAAEALHAEGVEALGVDIGYRSREWQQREPPWPYLRADGRELPFEDGSFDMVVSFGVIEHVGIQDEIGADVVAPDYEAHRARYVSEALRVLRRPGLAIFAQPNGACPIDFWHYTGSAPLRFHAPTEPFLPRYAELRHWALSAAPDARVVAESPYDLLAFERITDWWYGRAFAGTLQAGFQLMRRPRARWLARSAANPFLVTTVRLPA